jgi:hypothetical protein
MGFINFIKDIFSSRSSREVVDKGIGVGGVVDKGIGKEEGFCVEERLLEEGKECSEVKECSESKESSEVKACSESKESSELKECSESKECSEVKECSEGKDSSSCKEALVSEGVTQPMEEPVQESKAPENTLDVVVSSSNDISVVSSSNDISVVPSSSDISVVCEVKDSVSETEKKPIKKRKCVSKEKASEACCDDNACLKESKKSNQKKEKKVSKEVESKVSKEVESNALSEVESDDLSDSESSTEIFVDTTPETPPVAYYDVSCLSEKQVFQVKLRLNNLLSTVFSYHKPLMDFYFSQEIYFKEKFAHLTIGRDSKGYYLRDNHVSDPISGVVSGLLDIDSTVHYLLDYLKGKGFSYCKFVIYPNHELKDNYYEFCESDILGLLRDNFAGYSFMAKGVKENNRKIANRMGNVYMVSIQKGSEFGKFEFDVSARSKYERFFKLKPFNYKISSLEVLIKILF